MGVKISTNKRMNLSSSCSIHMMLVASNWLKNEWQGKHPEKNLNFNSPQNYVSKMF
jgi:hypothetical protein